MNTVGQRERVTQNRIVRLLQTRLGYTYLGNWEIWPKHCKQGVVRGDG